MEMLDQQGQVHDIPDHLAVQAFQSGQYGFRPDAKIPVINQAGTVGTLSPEQAQAAFSKGVRLASPDEFHKAEVENKYGDVAGGLGAFGAGAVNSLALGAGDALITGVAGLAGGDEAKAKARDYLSGVKEAHPYASTAGEVAGFAAPLVATGGGSAAAEGAEGGGLLARAARLVTAPSRAVSALGEGAGELAAGIVGRGAESLAGRAMQKAAQLGAQGMVEGSIYGGGNAMSEAALGDTDITADKILAGMKHGAMLGGAGGAALGAASELTAAAAEKIGEKLAPILKRATSDETLSEWLAGKAEESAAKAAGPLKRDYGRLGEDRIKRMGRTMLEDLPEESGKPFWKMGQQDILDAATTAKAKVGKALDNFYAKADETAALNPEMHWPSGQKLLERARAELIDPMLGNPALKDIGVALDRKLEPYQEAFAGKELGFRQLWDIRKGLDETINYERLARTPLEKRLRTFRGMLDDEIQRAGDEISGGTFSGELRKLNDKYADLSEVTKLTKKTIDRADANRFISPSDYGMGFLGAVLHGGVSPASFAVGFATGAVNHFLRKEGRQILATGLDRASALTQVGEAAAAVDAKVDGAIEGFLSRGGPKAGTAPAYLKATKETGRSAYHTGLGRAFEEKTDEVHQIAGTPALAADKVQQSIGHLANHAPNLSAAMTVKATNAVAYLSAKAPAMGRPGALQPGLEKGLVSRAEIVSWYKSEAAVRDPLTVLDDLEHHRVSMEGAQAFRETSPDLFREVQTKMMQKVSEKGSKLSYAQKVQIGLLFDFPADWSMQPDNVRVLQQPYQAGGPQQPQMGGGKGGGHVRATGAVKVQGNMLKQLASGTQKASMR